MGCISSLAKYIIFLFNFLISICAIILIVFGVLFVIHQQDGVAIFSTFTVGGFAIAIGVLIFLIAFFGCCGAIKESSCMLTIYAVILLILFVLQIVLASLIFIKISDEDDFYNEVHKLIEDLYQGTDTSSQNAVDALQQAFKCCGVDGPSYWGASYPKSCCEDQTTTTCTNPYGVGCAKKFKEVMEDNIKIIGGVAIGFAIVELLGAIFAFMVRNKRSEYA